MSEKAGLLLPGLLLIGKVEDWIHQELAHSFEVHDFSQPDNETKAALDRFLDKNAANIQAVATNGHDGLALETMARLPDLQAISCYGVGYEGIDAKAAAARGIWVSHTPDVLNDDVANTAIMLLLATGRCLIRDDRFVREGRWAQEGNAPVTRAIAGKTVALLGMGRIGMEIARKLSVFSCEVVYHTRTKKNDLPYRYYDNLGEMAQAADYLVIIVPGGAETSGIVDGSVLDKLGPEGILVNVARGSVVDEPALIEALQTGRLAAAGLDVFAHEPHVPPAFFAMDNVVLLPHAGSATVETRKAMGDLMIENLLCYFSSGRVKTPVPECSGLIPPM